ncbi:hypothetical protein PROFUN_13169 [Planoprotostelium fungivorum]|uniref:Uncharacterized protein n=1 Tax=Planoprotostelium fungivorum TaxID=1890364 RepID=A0A2P6N543_9EUKA|nr:hypothetical protein PROFUN_13169 [Planoprotostelium fungivorum]
MAGFLRGLKTALLGSYPEKLYTYKGSQGNSACDFGGLGRVR